MQRLYNFLDKSVFPYVVAFFAHPLSISLTLLLFIPMIGFNNDVILILLLNSYMNVGSFGTSQITLREVRLTAEAENRRAQETHDTVMEELAELKEIIIEQKEIIALLRKAG